MYRVPTGQDGVTRNKLIEVQDSGYRVFLTEQVASRRDPAVTPVHSSSDIEEWPRDGDVINYIEPPHEQSMTQRSPSYEEKTQIPEDILAELHGDPLSQNHSLQSQKLSKPFNALPESMTLEEHANCMVITEGGMSAPSWRPPRSRTPIQFSATPSRSVPKPLKQPSVDSVPRSLSVHRLGPSLQPRPKSTSLHVTSPVEPQVEPVLSDSSLHPEVSHQSTTQGFSTPTEQCSITGGSVPPPPSPEVSLQNVITQASLETLNEEDERSSIAASLLEDPSVLKDITRPLPLGEEDGKELGGVGKQFPPLDKAEYEKRITAEEIEIKVENYSLGNRSMSKEENVNLMKNPTEPAEEDTQTTKGNQEKSAVDLVHHDDAEINLETSVTGEAVHYVPSPEMELDIARKETSYPVSPQPPCSPELNESADFTNGLDLNLDLEAELQAAMSGLSDLQDGGENEWGVGGRSRVPRAQAPIFGLSDLETGEELYVEGEFRVSRTQSPTSELNDLETGEDDVWVVDEEASRMSRSQASEFEPWK